MTSTAGLPPEVRERRWSVPPLILLVIPVVYLAMATLIDRPFVFPDEAGAITNARYLAGEGAASPWWYLPGYGALFAPALWFTSDLGVITWVYQIINAALGLLSGLGVLRYATLRFPDVDPRRRAAASVVVMLYPAYQYFASLAIADNLLITAGIWSVLAVERMRGRGVDASAWALAVAIGAAGVVHSRAIVIVVAAAVALALEPRLRRLAAVVVVTGVVATLVARTGLAGDVETVHSLDGRQSLVDLVRANAGLRPLAVLPFTLLGQIINVVSATAGVLALGAFVLLRSTFRFDGRRLSSEPADGDRHVLLLIAFAALLSAAFTNQGQGDLAVYGRYLEVVAPLPMVVGLLWLVERPIPQWLRSVGPSALVLAACVLVGMRGYDAFETRIQILNVSGIGLAIRPFNRIDPILIALFGAAGMVAISEVARRRPSFVLPGMVLLFFASVIVPFERSVAYLDRVGNEAELASLLDEVGAAAPLGCVGLDQSALRDPWAQENYQMQRLDVDFQYFWSEREAPPCSDLVISSRHEFSRVATGWRAIGWEQSRQHWLWASPGLVNELGIDQAILPDPGQPITSLSADVEVAVAGERTGDRVVDAVVTVTNRSAATFIPSAQLPAESFPVRLGIEWRNPADPAERLHEPVRFELTEPLRPGQSQTVTVALPLDLPDLSVDEGTWQIRAELVQELVQWAGDRGAGSTTIDWSGS